MKSHFIRLRNFLIRLKVYMSRTSGYISIINTAMILFLFLSNLERYNIDVPIQQWIIPLFLIGISLMLFFGYLEDRLGFYRQEQKTTQSRSPYFHEILKKLDNIEERLEKLEKS